MMIREFDSLEGAIAFAVANPTDKVVPLTVAPWISRVDLGLDDLLTAKTLEVGNYIIDHDWTVIRGADRPQ